MHDDGFTSQSPLPDARTLGVLVGFDDSDHSVLALHYAARAAQRLDAPLTVVTAYTVPTMAYADAVLIPSVPAEVARLAAAQELLEQAREHLRGYPGEVDLRTEHGDAAGVLVKLSAQAQLAVVVPVAGAGSWAACSARSPPRCPPTPTAPPWWSRSST